MSKGKKGIEISIDAIINPGPGAYDANLSKFPNISYSMSGLER